MADTTADTRLPGQWRDRLSLGGFLALAFLISQVPVIGLPFEWFETFLHETSHALAAVLTGGDVRRFVLNVDGSGAVFYAGGIQVIVGFAGYAGTIIWGCLLWLAATGAGPRASKSILIVLGLSAILAPILWTPFTAPVTWLVSLAIAAIPLLACTHGNGWLARHLPRFMGAFAVVSGFASILMLLNPQIGHNDAQILSGATGIPGIIWIVLWLLAGLGALYGTWKLSAR